VLLKNTATLELNICEKKSLIDGT